MLRNGSKAASTCAGPAKPRPIVDKMRLPKELQPLIDLIHEQREELEKLAAAGVQAEKKLLETARLRPDFAEGHFSPIRQDKDPVEIACRSWLFKGERVLAKSERMVDKTTKILRQKASPPRPEV